jgi:hypothetical protein
MTTLRHDWMIHSGNFAQCQARTRAQSNIPVIRHIKAIFAAAQWPPQIQVIAGACIRKARHCAAASLARQTDHLSDNSCCVFTPLLVSFVQKIAGVNACACM